MDPFFSKSIVALIGCSNSHVSDPKEFYDLCSIFSKMGLCTEIFPSACCQPDNTTLPPAQRARDLMEAFRRPDIGAIFDISGGDAANAVLSYLDFAEIAKTPKPFFGYSDVSVLLNPLYQLAGVPVYYFQAKFLKKELSVQKQIQMWVQRGDAALLPPRYTFLQGEHMEGTLCGGNTRCTLKLAGTPWQPNFTRQILFLESHSGDLPRMETMLYQYRHIGAFDQCCGVLLGQFHGISEKNQFYTRVLEILGRPELPVAQTPDVGHQSDSRCLPYHKPLVLHREE